MGMFDEFITSENLVCLKCKKEIRKEKSNIVLQSKVFECLLDKYKQGTRLQKPRKDNFFIKEGWVEAHTGCDKCHKYIQFKLIIEEGKWIRTEPWK